MRYLTLAFFFSGAFFVVSSAIVAHGIYHGYKIQQKWVRSGGEKDAAHFEGITYREGVLQWVLVWVGVLITAVASFCVLTAVTELCQ